MTHRFPLKEIARQAGLSTATIDRAVNNRAHVSPQTKARVAAAIAELEGQELLLAARGRRLFFDMVIEAPARFSHEVKSAAEQAVTAITPAVCRPRFTMQEIMTEAEVVRTLARIVKRGSHGVCLKLRDLPAIREAVNNVIAAGIPVVTLVTDLTGTGRIASVGSDNQSAGRTAAYLVKQCLQGQSGTVLALRSNDRFVGEEEREIAFADRLSALCPDLRIISASGGSGVHYDTARLMAGLIDQLGDLRAVYSMGGGNGSILAVLHDHNLRPDVFIAHDLDRDNRALLRQGALDFVLHHDLATDLRNVFHAFLAHHKLVADMQMVTQTHIQISTPENMPDP